MYALFHSVVNQLQHCCLPDHLVFLPSRTNLLKKTLLANIYHQDQRMLECQYHHCTSTHLLRKPYGQDQAIQDLVPLPRVLDLEKGHHQDVLLKQHQTFYQELHILYGNNFE